MKLTDRTKAQVGVVLLYDPIPLEKVSLDKLKAGFPTVTSYLPESEAITAEATDNKVWVQIFSARTEFVDQNEGTDFSSDALSPLKLVLSALPPIRIRSFGVNLHVKGTVDGFEIAGDFVTRTLMRDVDKLEERLKAKIIASAQRFTYGEQSKYYDVRITPEELQGPHLHVQLHRHTEVDVTDPELWYADAKSVFEAGVKELDRVVGLV